MTGERLLGLTVTNVALLIVSLGLAWPWVQVRKTRFLMTHLRLEGPLDLAVIQQEAQAAAATGEAMTDFVDTGFLDLDLGF